MGKYDDIINLPHYQSPKRAQMPLSARAAQFAPFAALTGYGAAVEETARLTDRKIELSDGSLEELNEVLRTIQERMQQMPKVRATWFLPDGRKDGGAYVTKEMKAVKMDLYEQALFLEDGTQIPLADLYSLQIVEE